MSSIQQPVPQPLDAAEAAVATGVADDASRLEAHREHVSRTWRPSLGRRR